MEKATFVRRTGAVATRGTTTEGFTGLATVFTGGGGAGVDTTTERREEGLFDENSGGGETTFFGEGTEGRGTTFFGTIVFFSGTLIGSSRTGFGSGEAAEDCKATAEASTHNTHFFGRTI